MRGEGRGGRKASRTVSQRPPARDQLQEAERLGHLGSWEWDVRAKRLAWSDELYRIFEVDPGEFELTDESVLGLVHPDDHELVLSMADRSLTTGLPFNYEHRIVVPRGQVKIVHVRGFAKMNGGGRAVAMYGTVQDVTGLRAMERALVRSEKRFRAIAENASDLIALLDPAGRRLYVNPAHDVLGGDREALVGEDAFGIVLEEDRERVRGDFQAVVATGASRRVEYRAHGADGAIRHVESRASAVLDPSGNVEFVVVVSRDITGRIEADQRTRRHADLTRRLLERLVGAQELERRRVSDSLHDLIGQNLTALGIDLASLQQRLHGQSAAADARIDAMRVVVEDTICAIRDVMSELRPPALEEYGLVPALRAYGAEFEERTGIRVKVSGPSSGAGLGKEAQLALFRIAQEALTNAAKHSGAASVKISVDADDEGTRLAVEDDGRGFSDPVGAREAQRGGWGLPTMRERAASIGGALVVELPGRGTRVVVAIPARAGAAERERS